MAVNKSSKSGRERRESERAEARLTMRIDADALKDVPQIVTQSENISASGVYCFASHSLPLRTHVSLSIVLPALPGQPAGTQIVRTDALVVRSIPNPKAPAKTPYELAFMFLSLGHVEKAQLHEFVLWRNLQTLREALGQTTTAKPARKTPKKQAGRKTSAPKAAPASKRKAAAKPFKVATKKSSKKKATKSAKPAKSTKSAKPSKAAGRKSKAAPKRKPARPKAKRSR